jgi:rhodanese-related sulfurtransferase
MTKFNEINMIHRSSFEIRSLVQQGYCGRTAAELQSLKWGLRFTPTVCMLVSAYGLVTHNAALLVAMAAMGIIPFWFPSAHPLDRLYNRVVAPLFHAARLPPNPLPRRIACVSGGAMNLAGAVLLHQGLYTAAYVVGGLLFALQLIVNTTHFCLASFMIEMVLRLFGKSLPAELVDGAQARALVGNGALLLDVRDESEFAFGHLPGAINIPVTRLRAELARLRDAAPAIVLYCASGGRSKIAHGLLAQAGFTGVHDLGGIGRWPDSIGNS